MGFGVTVRVESQLALNDIFARRVAVRLEELGYSIPRDMSLAGFDNDMRARFHDISTVDFGMENL